VCAASFAGPPRTEHLRGLASVFDFFFCQCQFGPLCIACGTHPTIAFDAKTTCAIVWLSEGKTATPRLRYWLARDDPVSCAIDAKKTLAGLARQAGIGSSTEPNL
jgi:hypothetical protein